MATVQLEDLCKRFGDVVAVDHVTLDVRDRELLVLVGPSGCGKTTTLRMIAGLESLSSGTIRIGERVVNDVAPKDRNIAMVFQKYALYPHMNVYQNMAFGLKMRRVARAEIDERVRQASDILGIEDLMKRKPAELSGGQQQRVAVGRAIVRDPDVFLFDEPLSNLDAKLRVKMRSELVKLHRRLEATMVYVTHDQVEAMMMGDRIVVMHGGRVQQVGEPLEVYERPANRFVAEFIGSPPMNFFEGRIAGDSNGLGVTVAGQNLRLPDSAEYSDALMGRDVTLGIRPEDIRVGGEEPTGGNWVEVDARVVVVQPLGAETIVELASDLGDFLARVASGVNARAGDNLKARFDMAGGHLFDGATEERV